ncbi:hypothetical protein [Paraburkholderia humisilvae]|uniref:Uncharacterized protein n=1 Tax=Paraburkholderia humisilvae TaxID=627669 RepID=A0A6J5FAD4_9BURK|nr:hypothetical protein [Paraburkholderia humisilvae]CAB3774397.1 hypothetical protein LMG29542_07779 [Paraburkholderia humisilvae]
MNRKDENDHATAILVATFGVVAGVFGFVWLFSRTLNLDMNCGAAVLGNLFAFAICLWGVLVLGLLKPTDILPAALAGLWACFWPALSDWCASTSESDCGVPDDVVWWATWYIKLGVFVGILLAGYGGRWRQRR